MSFPGVVGECWCQGFLIRTLLGLAPLRRLETYCGPAAFKMLSSCLIAFLLLVLAGSEACCPSLAFETLRRPMRCVKL